MNLIYQGKTKDVYDNGNGTYTFKLKDDATGKDGVFDPGENAVGLSIEGLGRESLKISVYYFELLKAAGIPTHYLGSDISNATMDVIPAKFFGNGLEFICRCKADGSFIRRYGAYTSFAANLDYFVEITIKDDERKDPPIEKDALIALGIMTAEEYNTCKELTKKVTKILEKDLASKKLELFDIKFEFGKSEKGVMLTDEISAGSMRVYKDGVIVPPMELGKLILS